MYFAVLGKNPEISIAELELVQAKEISYPKKGIMIFDTKYSELLPQLWGCIKIGTVVKEKDLQELLTDVKIIGIQNEANGKHLKRTVWIRRYKLVDVFHTDKEIKNKGKEIINLENGLYGVVEWYQNIELYEAVDFGKPGRSMQMGMMPAKLAHIMINIWLKNIIENWKFEIENCVIYDPFVWSGTTGMLANYLWYDFIWSDINISYAEQNALWRATNKFHTPNKQFEIFHHDITQKIWEIRKKSEKTPTPSSENFSDLSEHFSDLSDILIVTEWRLWPIVTKTTAPQDIQKFQEQVLQLYKSFLDRIKETWSIAVFTIPYYAQQNNSLEKNISEYATKINLQIKGIPEIYGREGQQVGRKILIST